MNVLILYLVLLKATLTTFAGMACGWRIAILPTRAVRQQHLTSFVDVLGHGGYTLIRATFPEGEKMAKSPYGVVFNRSAAIVGIAKDHPLSLSESLRRRIERLGDEYGYWYEARIGTIEISWVKKFKGAWDKGVEKPEQFLSEESHGVYFSDPRHLLGVSRLSTGTRMIGGGRILRHPIGESDA